MSLIPTAEDRAWAEGFKAAEAEITDLRLRLAAVERERDAWKDTAEQHCRNQFFYHGLVTKIGEAFGIAAKTSDDGSVQQDVLALKVPELVDGLHARGEALEAAIGVFLEGRMKMFTDSRAVDDDLVVLAKALAPPRLTGAHSQPKEQERES